MAEELTKEEQQKAAAEQQKKALEELVKKIVLADDYEEEHYKKYGIQDLVVARNSAKATMEKGKEEGKDVSFVTRRVEFLENLVSKRSAEHQTLLKSPSFKETDYAGVHMQDLAALAGIAKAAKENASKQEKPDENFIKFAAAKEQFFTFLVNKRRMDANNAKMLATPDFDEKHYEKTSIQQLLMVRNMAETTAAKQSESKNADPNLIEFFNKREKFFTLLILKKLPEVEKIWCVYTKQTQMPYLTCDDETGNDQAWIFTAENVAKISMEKILQKEEYPYEIKAIEKKDFINFYVALMAMGVNEVVVDKGAAAFAFELEKLINKPDFSKSVINQQLLLTAIYFSQQQKCSEQHRDAEKMEELFEEVKADIVRGDLLLSGLVPEGVEKPAVTDMKYPQVQGKDGERYQLIFTDVTEIVKYATMTKQKFQPVPVKGEGLLAGIKKSAGSSENAVSGLILNPASLAITLKIN